MDAENTTQPMDAQISDVPTNRIKHLLRRVEDLHIVLQAELERERGVSRTLVQQLDDERTVTRLVRAELTDTHKQVEALTQEHFHSRNLLDEAQKEIEILKREQNADAERYTVCLYCSHRIPYRRTDDASIEHAYDEMVAHDLVCEKNPLARDALRWRALLDAVLVP